MQNLIEGKDSENTRKATKNAVVTFLAYWNEVKVIPLFWIAHPLILRTNYCVISARESKSYEFPMRPSSAGKRMLICS